jgi:hypothetical protein
MEALFAVRRGGLYKLLRYRESGRETLRAAFCLSADPDEMCPLTDQAILAELELLRRDFAGTGSNGGAKRGVAASSRRRAA